MTVVQELDCLTRPSHYAQKFMLAYNFIGITKAIRRDYIFIITKQIHQVLFMMGAIPKTVMKNLNNFCYYKTYRRIYKSK